MTGAPFHSPASRVLSPDEVRAQAREHLEAGLDGLIINMPDAYDLDTVALAGDTLRDL